MVSLNQHVGQIAKFDPISEQFTEFENAMTGLKVQELMSNWGMDYSSDGAMWYTDGSFDSYLAF